MTGAQAPDALARLRADDGEYPALSISIRLSSRFALGSATGCAAGRRAGLRRALHEIAPAAPIHLGAATRLRAGAGRAGRQSRRRPGDALDPDRLSRALEAGAPYGPGLDLFGLPSRGCWCCGRRARSTRCGRWRRRSNAARVASVIAELPDDAADLTATRRLSLAARDAWRARPAAAPPLRRPMPSAAATRWQVAAAPGPPDAFGGLGRTALPLSLVKNRRGPCGRWRVTWDHHERRLPSPAYLSVWLRRLPTDRLDAALACTGRPAARRRRAGASRRCGSPR